MIVGARRAARLIDPPPPPPCIGVTCSPEQREREQLVFETCLGWLNCLTVVVVVCQDNWGGDWWCSLVTRGYVIAVYYCARQRTEPNVGSSFSLGDWVSVDDDPQSLGGAASVSHLIFMSVNSLVRTFIGFYPVNNRIKSSRSVHLIRINFFSWEMANDRVIK